MAHSTTHVYLIHFARKIGNQDNPHGTAQHYLGSANLLERRLSEHQAGTGARLMQVVREAGIQWVVARTWPGGRKLEFQLKRQHNSPKNLCPVCRGEIPLSAYPLYD